MPAGYIAVLSRRLRVKRRTVLQAGACGAAGLAAAALGCVSRRSGSSAGSGRPSAGQPKHGGSISLFTPSGGAFIQDSMDPHVVTGQSAGTMSLFYQQFVRFNPASYAVEPELAAKWEQPSPTEYVFHVSPGVKWHNKPPANGRALTAADIVFSLNRIRTADDPRFTTRSLLFGVSSIEAVDPSTVKLTTKAPDVTTLTNLCDFTMLILNPEVVEHAGKFTTAADAVGTGAFILQAKDDLTGTTVRNPDYWKPGLPYLDGVRIVWVKDQQAAWSQYLAKQFPICAPLCAPPEGTDVKKLVAEQGTTYQAAFAKSRSPNMLRTNVRKKPLDDPRVTRALRLLVDHQEAVSGWAEVWFGGGRSQTLPHAFDDWDLPSEDYAKLLEWKQPKDDVVKEALDLLKAAGFSADNPLKLQQAIQTSVNYVAAEGQLLQSQWSRLSKGAVQTQIRTYDSPAMSAISRNGEFEVLGPWPNATYFEVDQIFHQIYHSKGGVNFGGYADATLDAMIDRQVTLFDTNERKAAVKEIVRYLIDHAPYVSFADPDNATVWDAKVKGFSPQPLRWPGYMYESVWLDV